MMDNDEAVHEPDDCGPAQDRMPGGDQRMFVKIDADVEGQRLDRVLAAALSGISRSRIQSLIKNGSVCAVDVDHSDDGGRAVTDPSARVRVGQIFTLVLPEPVSAVPEPEAMALDIRFEDENLIVINKPAGMVVHPAPGNYSGTLVNGLLAHCGDSLSGIGGVRRPGIVHRLDKDTSGLLVVAKNDHTHQGLSEQFQLHGSDGRLHRGYMALVWGVPSRPKGSVDAALGRSTKNRLKIAVMRGPDDGGQGRRAVTHYTVVQKFDRACDTPKPNKPPELFASLLNCELETGRTHQIRVHMTHIGHPLLGDTAYGAGFAASARKLTPEQRAALEILGRQALHAQDLGFEHPVTREIMKFHADPPSDLQRLIKVLGEN